MMETMKVENPKVGLFYEDNIPYLTIEFSTDIKGEKANLKIHKIKLDTINLSQETIANHFTNPKIPSFIFNRSNKIAFEIVPVNKEGEIYSISVDTNKKKMTKEEIENKLGYDIEIID